MILALAVDHWAQLDFVPYRSEAPSKNSDVASPPTPTYLFTFLGRLTVGRVRSRRLQPLSDSLLPFLLVFARGAGPLKNSGILVQVP